MLNFISKFKIKQIFFLLAFLWLPLTVSAETVDVKYRGSVNLGAFTCTSTVSSFVDRVCYDQKNSYLLISLSGTYYHYCGIELTTVKALLNAESKGRFFNAAIKGKYDCRVGYIPNY
jgi:hypothetical protein